MLHQPIKGPAPSVRPVTAQDPAWFVCGSRVSPDYGHVFMQPVAMGAVAYWFDREQKVFACRMQDGPTIDGELIVQNRSFRVMGWTEQAQRAGLV